MYEFDDRRLFDAVRGNVGKIKGPSATGWYTARCPFPDHSDKTASFGFTEKGYNCQGCGRQGSLRQLAQELGLLLPEPPRPQQRSQRLTAAEATARIRGRGVRDETAAHFDISPDLDKQAWRMPIGANGLKLKAFNPEAKQKYWWAGPKPPSGAEVYNLAACEGAEEVWLLEGEPDVWIGHQAGLRAASLTCGATGNPRPGLEALAAAGVKVVRVVYDRDAAGRNGAMKVADAASALGIRAVVHELPEVVGEKGDITDLYRTLGRDDAALAAALRSLPVNESVTEASPDNGAPAADSVAHWQPPIPLEEVDVPEFPLDVLPGWASTFARQLSEMLQTPADMAGMMILSALSASIARKVMVKVRDGWYEPINVYTATAAPPASRKSAVRNAIVSPIEAFEKDERCRLAPEVARANLRRTHLEAQEKRIRTELGKADNVVDEAVFMDQLLELTLEMENLEVVTAPRLLVDNSTPEALVITLGKQGGRVAILEAEDGVFGVLAGRYSRSPDLTPFLKAYSEETIRIDRVGREGQHVERPTLTIGLLFQPVILEKLRGESELRGTGLLARFAFSVPRNTVGGRKTRTEAMREDVRAAYNEAMLRLLSVTMPAEAHVLRFDAPATSRMEDFMDRLEPHLGPFGRLGGLADWAGKLAGLTARIAALLHLGDRAADPEPWAESVCAETLDRAITLAEYLIPHAVAAHARMGMDPAIRKAEFVWGWIARQQHDTLAARTIYEGVKGTLPTMSDLRSALDLLVEHGYLREAPGAARSGPGRKPSPTYQVNPLARAHNSHNSPDSAN